jgi:hypothetical protein
MTDDKITLRELLEKGSDTTLLREMIRFAATTTATGQPMTTISDDQPSPEQAEKALRPWIIQRSIAAFENHYEAWPSYYETLLTLDEMLKALKACQAQWPALGFRGHNVVNQKPGSDRLRYVS